MASALYAAATVVASAATTAAASLLTAGFTQGVGVTLANFAVRAALFATASFITAPQVGAGGSPTDWTADPDAGIPFVVGRRGVAGVIVHRDEWGPDNRYQSFVTVYSAAGPINGFGTFTADQTAVTFSGSYDRALSGTWQDVMWMDRRYGAQPDTALETPADRGDGTVSGTMPEWGSAYKLSGKACSLWTLALDRDRKRYPSGEPRPLQVIEGIVGYDPRLDSTYPGGSGSCRLGDRSTYVYITNGIIGGLNWALGLVENAVIVGGIGAAISSIDVAAFVSCANVADANGWTCSAAFTTKDDKHQVLLGLLQSGGATYANAAGKISCVSRATPKTSIRTITAADTAGPLELDTAASRLSRINTIIPRCVLESHEWEMHPLDPLSVSEYVTEDGGKRPRGLDYPFVSDAQQAAQLAAYDIVDSREGITGRIPLKSYCREMKPGDAFTITEPGFVLDGQKFLVLERTFDPATSGVVITFRSETDAKHDYALGLSTTPPAAPSLTPADPYNFPAPDSGDWSSVASTIEGENGETRPSVILTGSVSNAQVALVEISYRYRAPDGAGDWVAWSPWRVFGTYEPTTTSIEIDSIPPGAQVETSIRYLSIFGQPSVESLTLAAVTVSGRVVSTDTGSVGGRSAIDLVVDVDRQAEIILENALNQRERVLSNVANILGAYGTATEFAAATEGFAVAAETSASEAEGYVTTATAAAVTATGAASTATTQAGVATSAANAAGLSASAASGFSSSASSFADDAGASATAAFGYQTNAETAASNASTSAASASTASTNAATSASNASTSASTAAGHASTASGAASSSTASASAALEYSQISATFGASAKQDVQNAEDFFTTDADDLDYSSGAFNYWTESYLAGYGYVVSATNNPAPFLCRARFIPVAQRRYRATVRWRFTTGSPGTVYVGFRVADADDGGNPTSRFGAVTAGSVNEWREASYEITATDAMALESWRPFFYRTGATGTIQVASLVWQDVSAIRAAGQDSTVVYSTADDAYAARMIQTSAGAASATITLVARQTDGDAASRIVIAANTIAFGADELVEITDTGEIIGWDSTGLVKMFYWNPAEETLQIRKSDGTLQWDSDAGGVTVDGLPPESQTQVGTLGTASSAFSGTDVTIAGSSITGMLDSGATTASGYLVVTTTAYASNGWEVLLTNGVDSEVITSGTYITADLEGLGEEFVHVIMFTETITTPFGGNCTANVRVTGAGNASARVRLTRGP